jgi:hypothetical protein
MLFIEKTIATSLHLLPLTLLHHHPLTSNHLYPLPGQPNTSDPPTPFLLEATKIGTQICRKLNKTGALKRVRPELTDGTGVIPTTLFGDGTGSISLVGARKVT